MTSRSGGFSKARLGRMRDVMAGHVERGAMPGLVTLLSRRDEVHVEALGRMAADGGRPMARDTIFRIASMNKPVAAAAAMSLLEEPRLRPANPGGRPAPQLPGPRRLPGGTGPGIGPRSPWPAIRSRMRPSRAFENPPLLDVIVSSCPLGHLARSGSTRR